MTALQEVKAIEAEKAKLITECRQHDILLREAKQRKCGTTVAMRAHAQVLQEKISVCNKELEAANQKLLSAGAGAELLPCPFCGSVAALTHSVPSNGHVRDKIVAKHWFVMCVNQHCRCSLRKRYSPNEAIRVWQDRSQAVFP